MRETKMAYSIDEAAECTGIGRNTLRKLIEWKKLPVLKVGRKLLIRADTIETFMLYAEDDPLRSLPVRRAFQRKLRPVFAGLKIQLRLDELTVLL